LNILIFVIVINTIGIFSLSYSQEIQAQTLDIIFETTNASVQSFNDNNFIVNFNNLNENKEICISGDCSFEIIKFHDSGHPTGGIGLPTPEIQSMYSGVDIRIQDAAYNNMSELERDYQERWRIWANCDIEGTQKDTTVFVCGTNEYDKITISNDMQGIEIQLQLVSGTYDPKLDVLNFTANFVE
jgi:hypothetical protein